MHLSIFLLFQKKHQKNNSESHPQVDHQIHWCARSWWGSPVRINPFSSGSSRMGPVWEVRADGEKMDGKKAPKIVRVWPLITWNSGAFFFEKHSSEPIFQASNFRGYSYSFIWKGVCFFLVKLEVVTQFWCLNMETNSKIRPNDLSCSILYTHVYAIYMVEGFFPRWLLEDVIGPWPF